MGINYVFHKKLVFSADTAPALEKFAHGKGTAMGPTLPKMVKTIRNSPPECLCPTQTCICSIGTGAALGAPRTQPGQTAFFYGDNKRDWGKKPLHRREKEGQKSRGGTVGRRGGRRRRAVCRVRAYSLQAAVPKLSNCP